METAVNIDFHCIGNERMLSDCSATSVSCSNTNIAGVVCGGMSITIDNNYVSVFV